MLSVHAAMEAIEPLGVDRPSPEDVMRHYLKERADEITREKVAAPMGIKVKALDHITSGRRGISMSEVFLGSGEQDMANVFRALAKLVEREARGEVAIRRLDLDAVAAGKAKQKASGGPPRDRKAKEGAARKGRPAKQSPDKSPEQLPAPTPSARGR